MSEKATITKIGYKADDGTLRDFHFEGGDAGISVDGESGATLYAGYTLKELEAMIEQPCTEAR